MTWCSTTPTDAARSAELVRFNLLRQQEAFQGEGRPNRSLADFVAPRGSGQVRLMSGRSPSPPASVPRSSCASFEQDHDDYRAIMVKALADRLAEAFAEYLHARVRREWGYAPGESLSNEELIAERYRGIRPAFGYPACPDHSEKFKLFELLDVTASTGMAAHGVGGHDAPGQRQRPLLLASRRRATSPWAASAATRWSRTPRARGMEVAEAERWLAPNLGYEPGAAPPA